MTWPDTTLTDEQLEALRRCATKPDLDGGTWTAKRDQRVYQPLVFLGLVTREVRPYPADERYEIVHYEATEAGHTVIARCAEKAS